MSLFKRFLAVLRRFGDPSNLSVETMEEKLARLAKEALALVVDWVDARQVLVVFYGDEFPIGCYCDDPHNSRHASARIHGLHLGAIGIGESFTVHLNVTRDEGGQVEAPDLWYKITGIDTPRPRASPIVAPKSE